MNNHWINHPGMNSLDPAKLELIKTAALQVNGKSGSTLASFMMSLIISARKKGIVFSSDEMSLILEILKDGKSSQEKEQIDNMVKMVKTYMRKGN